MSPLAYYAVVGAGISVALLCIVVVVASFAVQRDLELTLAEHKRQAWGKK